MNTLPPRAWQVIENIVERAGVRGRRAAELRSDLERHVLDGLALGRPLHDLLERLGDPETVAPVLARGADVGRPLHPTGGGTVSPRLLSQRLS